jgi:hypothetical protein
MKLIEYQKETIERGTILRCKGVQPYEEEVEFLVCESNILDKNGYILMVSTGYKAGLKYCQFPEESIPEGYRMGLNKKWLIENWNKWGYFDCKIDDVTIFENAPISERK